MLAFGASTTPLLCITHQAICTLGFLVRARAIHDERTSIIAGAATAGGGEGREAVVKRARWLAGRDADAPEMLPRVEVEEGRGVSVVVAAAAVGVVRHVVCGGLKGDLWTELQGMLTTSVWEGEKEEHARKRRRTAYLWV